MRRRPRSTNYGTSSRRTGAESECGWLKDKYGLSWQIIPKALGRLFSDKDRVKANRAVQAMLKMRKIDIAKLQAAFDGA